MNAPSTSAPILTIDREAIRIFCDTVFGYLEGLVPVRCLAEKGTPPKSPSSEYLAIGALTERLIAMAQRAADDQRAVYVVPGTVATAGSARARDITQTGILLVDLDDGDITAKREHLVRHIGLPSLEVASGGTTPDGQTKLHLYWRLNEPAQGDEKERVSQMRAAIATKVGGDPSFDSLHQPIRVAGTIHGKHGIRVPVRLLAHRANEHELDELDEAVAAMPPMAGHHLKIDTGKVGDDGPNARSLARMKVHEGGADGITRFTAMSKVIGHWIRNVRKGECGRGEAWLAVVEHNAAMIVPPWEEDRLKRDFDRLLGVDFENHGPMPQHTSKTASECAAEAAPALSDDALAAAFVAAEGHLWRHVPVWKVWFHWDGKVWVRDQIGLVREQMRRVCRSACTDLKPQEARRVASERTIAAALRLVGTDPRIATAPNAWDADRMLLNSQGGVLDLETGQELPHDPTLLMTQITAASVGTGCPRWLAFLQEITGNDDALQRYLQRFAGYCLTGITTEQVFAFLHGQGANGKSVYIGILAHVLGSYAATATLDTFTASRAPRHLTELAGLRAARLVIVPETESGQAWAEARIKSVTGGEKLRANFMHQDHFEFLPQFKLLVAGNHRPALSNVGESMRRRLHLVPFSVTFPTEKRDPKLMTKLIAECDGILGWMVDGCADWLRNGLAPPQCVLDAAADYFSSEDLLGQWLDECCRIDPQAKEQSAVLFRSWKSWAEDRGLPWGSQKSLGEALRSRDFKSGKVGRGRGWHGLTLTRTASDGEVEV